VNPRITKIWLVAGALILFVLLFIAPKLPASSQQVHGAAETAAVNEGADLQVFLNLALQKLEPAKKVQLDQFVASKQFDSISEFWQRNKRPDLAAHFAEEKAKKTNAANDWFNAGNRYYYSVQFTQDKSEAPALYASAIRSFKKGLTLEPNNTDAKIMLASSYVDGSQDPMKGISLLREVEKTDSNNVKLQLSFAFFSVKSGQLDRAIQRFEKVLRVDSNYLEVYLHLADAYEQLNNTDKSIIMLEQYSRRTSDVTARVEVNKYIKQLKESK